MIEADRQYFEAMEQLFAHPSWRTFANDIQGWQSAISEQWRSLTPDQLRYEQGRYSGLEQVLKHAELCESLKASALQDDLDNEAD